MKSDEQIAIPLSKKKMFQMLMGSIGFVSVGFWFVFKTETINHPIFGSKSIIVVIGIVSIIFFGLCALFYIQKLFDKTPGLIIDNIGITNNSNGVPVDKIFWRDVDHVFVTNINNQCYIMVTVINPQEYIDNASNLLNKKLLQLNFNKYGTPLYIYTNALKTNSEDLFKIINEQLGEIKTILKTSKQLQTFGNYMSEWNTVQEEQKAICYKLKINWNPVDIQSMIAFNNSLFTDRLPINGLRHPETAQINGWYLWSGGDIPQEDNHFFKPLHVEHLLEKRPYVLKYLGLPAGWRFQVDDNGYEDIWYDESILNVL